ncbi:MAG: ATP-binding cassette domain-containing protein [Spirochaetaceae bacterium]|jgi:NitT/TauT family transport system ATP-binding protein|nr:ATP-binding cassette domain-containing protein [Spirochaetaceae bacterium]
MRLCIENLNFAFDSGKIFNDFSLDLSGVNPIFILGPSGCGKTTLLRLIAGLLSPQGGAISAGGEKPYVSFVFQEARLLPYMTVLENVALPLVRPFGRAKAEERARFFLSESALLEYADAYPDKLSGGQRQRVSIARAWAYPAPFILMDEPFQSLDIPLRIQLMDSVKRLMRTERRFVIAVTHDPREAIYLGKRIIVLSRPSGAVSAVTFDETVDTPDAERGFVSEASIPLEKKLVDALTGYRPAGDFPVTGYLEIEASEAEKER